MKITNKIRIVILTAFVVFGCEDPLDKTQLDLIAEDKVWVDPALVNAYFADLYSEAEFHLGTNDGVSENRRHTVTEMGGESIGRSQRNTLPTGEMTEAGASSIIAYWDWQDIRRINVAIAELSDPASTLDTDFRETRLGEAHFIRAWTYFSMAKRYGGLPLIKEPQDVSFSLEELQVPRNTEAATYDFIAEDCDLAEGLLVDKDAEWGRTTQWAALALKSRAMLYAGSIGEFGTVQLDGLVGIQDADKYWNLSLSASKKIIESGSFELYNAAPGGSIEEITSSYKDMMTLEDPGANKELIFVEQYNGTGGRYSFRDYIYHPIVGDNVNWGTTSQSYVETLERYEYIDGTPGTLDRSILVAGNRHKLADLFGNKDPRFYASIAIQESLFQGLPVYFHEGTYRGGVLQTSGTSANGIPAAGDARNFTSTAMLNIKGLDDVDIDDTYDGDNDWIVLRLGEIYLNYAEAALALGDPNGDGLQKLNAIRNRAGMPDKTELDWPTIKNERAVELGFENHRFWDLRRWRDGVNQLTDAQNGGAATFTGLHWFYDEDVDMYEITIAHEDYRPDPSSNGWRNFFTKHYYFPIGTGRIAANPVLIENPGYN